MALKKQAAATKLKMDRIQQAMLPLVAHPSFEEFMELISDLKDEAVEYSVSVEAVDSDSISNVVKGEIRAYLNLINIFQNQREQLEQQAKASD